MEDPRTPRPESVGWGGAPDFLRLLRDQRGTLSSPFGFLAAVIASGFVGGILMAGRYGNDTYRDVLRTLGNTLGL